jgi:hypothetical protein
MTKRALMPDGHVLEPKTFAQAQYRNDKWGDAAEMATFLVLAILCFEEKPDVVIVYGIWVHDKDGDDSNFSLFYDANGLMSDPLTRQRPSREWAKSISSSTRTGPTRSG